MAELTKFPESGVCWNPNGALLQYLKRRSTTKHGQTITTKELMEVGGLAWDKVSLWTVKYRSANTEYRLEELIRHMCIDLRDEVGQYPLTPEECYPPEKWCVKVDDKNYPLLTAFMLKHRSEWKNYRDEWELANGNFFHYPPFHISGHSSNKIEPTYKLVTTQQIMHVLTSKNNLKSTQNEGKKTTLRSSGERTSTVLKIPRFNLAIRTGDSIRATTIRCPKSKIRFGGLNSSD